MLKGFFLCYTKEIDILNKLISVLCFYAFRGEDRIFVWNYFLIGIASKSMLLLASC